MRRRKWLVVLVVLLVVLVLLPAILFVALVHNPFEGSVDSLDQLVPRDVALFARKAGVGADIDAFPETPFYARVGDSAAFRSLLDSPEWRDIDARLDLTRNLRNLEDTRSRLPISLEFGDNLFEVAVAADPSADGIPKSDILLLARVGWKVRAAYNLLDSDFVRSKIPSNYEIYPDEIGGYYEVHYKSEGKSKRAFFSRVKDVIALSNKPEMIQSFVSLGRGGSGLSLAYSEDYRRPPEAGGDEGSPAELFFSLTRGAERLKLDNFWQQFEKFLPARVALDALGAKFLDRIDGQFFFSDPPYARARASFRADVRALHEKRILTRAPLAVADVVARFGRFVPSDSMAFLFFRCDSRTVFQLFSTQLKAAERRLADDAVSKTEFKNFDGLLDRASAFLGDEVALVLSRRDMAKLVPKDRANPLPAGTVLWRVTDAAGLEQLIEKIEAGRFAVDEPAVVDVGGLELHAGLSKLDGSRIAYGVVGDVFVFSSSFDFAEKIAATHASPASGLAANETFQKSLARLSDRANVFAHVDAGNVLAWLGDYKERWANIKTEIKESRFIELRATYTRDLKAQDPNRTDAEVEAMVDARIAELVQRRKSVEIPTMIQKIERVLAHCRLVGAVGVSLRAEGEEVDARAVLQIR